MTTDDARNFAARYVKPTQAGSTDALPPGIRIGESMVSVYFRDGTLNVVIDHDSRADAPPVVVRDRNAVVWQSTTTAAIDPAHRVASLDPDAKAILRYLGAEWGFQWAGPGRICKDLNGAVSIQRTVATCTVLAGGGFLEEDPQYRDAGAGRQFRLTALGDEAADLLAATS